MNDRLTFQELIICEFSDPLRMKTAAKIGIACLIAELAEFYFHLPAGYWILISALVVMQLTMTNTVKKGIMRMAGTVMGCLLGFLLTVIFPDNPPALIALTSLWSLILIYISYRGICPYASLLAALTPIIVAFSGRFKAEKTGIIAFDRSLDIILGIMIAWLVTALLWPVDEEKELRAHSGKLIRLVLTLGLKAVEDSHIGGLLPRQIRQTLKRQEFLLHNADNATLPSSIKDTYASQFSLCGLLFTHIRHLLSNPEKPDDSRLSEDSTFIRNMASMLSEMNRLYDEKIPAYLEEKRGFIESCHGLLSREYLTLQKKGDSGRALRLKLLVHISNFIMELSLNDGDKRAPEELPGKPALFPGRKLDMNSVKNSLKATCAVCAAMFLWGNPLNNPQVGVSALLIAYMGHQSSSYRKMFYRLLGTIIGGIAGLCYIMALFHQNCVMIGLLPLMLFMMSYISLGDEEWNYGGLTAALCFIFCVSAALHHSNSAAIMLHRVEAVMLGSITAVLVMRFLLPTDYLSSMKNLEKELRSLYHALLECMRELFEKGIQSDAEMESLKKTMRGKMYQYKALSTDFLLDRLISSSEKKCFQQKSDAVISIYRDFSSLYFSLSHMKKDLPALAPPAFRDILKECAALTSVTGEPFCEERFCGSVKEAADALSRMQESPQPPDTRKELLFLEMILYDLSMLAPLLKKIAPEEGPEIPGSGDSGQERN